MAQGAHAYVGHMAASVHSAGGLSMQHCQLVLRTPGLGCRSLYLLLYTTVFSKLCVLSMFLLYLHLCYFCVA